MNTLYPDDWNGDQAAVEWLDEQWTSSGEVDWPELETGRSVANFDNEPDPDISQAVSSIINMIPSLVRAITNEEITSTADAETWLNEQQPSEQKSSEAWGAIIGTIASAIPAIIPVVRNIVNSARGRNRRQTQQPTPTQTQPSRSQPAGTRRVCSCRNVPVSSQQREAYNRAEFDEDFSEFIDETSDESVAAIVPLLTQLAPMLLQILPALIPLLTELVRTGGPTARQSVRGLSGSTTQQPTTSTRTTTARRQEAVEENEETDNFEGEPIFLS